MISVTIKPFTRICQGDVIRDLEYVEYVKEKEGICEISRVVFPHVIILTQDCDLKHDYKFRTEEKESQDKLLLSVLAAPLYNAEHVYLGEHLSELKIKSQFINKNKSPGDILRSNQNPRYHYLIFPDGIKIVPSVIDFKHYFSINTKYLELHKKNNFVCKVSELYREDISQRFASFLSRIGLPK